MWCIKGTLSRKTAAALIIAAAARGENETQHIYTLYLYDIAVYTYIVYNQCLIPRSYNRRISKIPTFVRYVVAVADLQDIYNMYIYITNIRPILCL